MRGPYRASALLVHRWAAVGTLHLDAHGSGGTASRSSVLAIAAEPMSANSASNPSTGRSVTRARGSFRNTDPGERRHRFPGSPRRADIASSGDMPERWLADGLSQTLSTRAIRSRHRAYTPRDGA